VATAEQTATVANIRNVLIATDFSRQSSEILRVGMSFCRAHAARPVILYVLSSKEFALAGFEAYAAARDAAERDLHAVKEQMHCLYGYEHGKDYELLLNEGDVAGCVFDVARDKHIDLIVVGTHGRSGLSKALLGSVAETIFRHSEIPVLTVGPSARHLPPSGPKCLLVPVDFTPVSQHSVAYGCALARKYEAELVLMHVIAEPPTHGAMADLECLKHGVEQRLAEFVPCEAKPGTVRLIVEYGTVVPKILEKAYELKSDLMVLGAHEYPHLRDQLRRKPAYELVREAPCPVLTVR
jgi:nucleotide-binding universal stress UspA family protein